MESRGQDCVEINSDMPDSGLDVLNDAGDSLEVALAKKLLSEV